MLAIESPMIPANAQNRVCAVEARMVWILKLRKKMKPSGASITTQISGVAASCW